MKVHVAKNSQEVKDLLAYLGSCHDASLIKISFKKDRSVGEDGSLIYPFGDMREASKCNVEIELIANNYPAARKDQIVVFEFQDTTSFKFTQDKDVDYSDIYEMTCETTKDAELSFDFYVTVDKIKVLSIVCKAITCKEL